EYIALCGYVSIVAAQKLCFLMSLCTLLCTLFPYTTLFRSRIVKDERFHQRISRTLLPDWNCRSEYDGDCSWFDHRRQDSFYRHRSEEHTSELQSRENLVCRLLLEKKKKEICTAIRANRTWI